MPPQIGKHGVVEIKTYDYGDFTDRKPEDFDFPCSDTWRGYYDTQFGYPDRRIYVERSDRVECSKPLENISKEVIELAQQAKLQSQENRRDLQEHFKHHSYLQKKKVKKYD